MLKFPAFFEQDENKSYTVTFRDIPEAITEGKTLNEARKAAQDALITAMDFYFEDNRNIPEASQMQANEELIKLPLYISIKVILFNKLLKLSLKKG